MADPLPAASPPRGLIVDLVTIVGPDGRPDLPRISRLVDWVAPHAAGLLLFGPEVGLSPELDAGARVEILRLAASRFAGPILACATRPGRAETRACAQALLAAGGETRPILVDAPLYHGSNRELLTWLAELADLGAQVVLYNHPRLTARVSGQTKRRNLRTAILKRAAAERPNLAGLVFQGDFRRLLNYHQAVRGKAGLRLYDAQEPRFLDQPSSAGVVSSGANLLPAAWALVVGAALHRGPKPPLAQVLAAAKALRALSRLAGDQGFLLAGLAGLGIIEPRGDPAEARATATWLEGLGLARWGLLPPRPATA